MNFFKSKKRRTQRPATESSTSSPSSQHLAAQLSPQQLVPQLPPQQFGAPFLHQQPGLMTQPTSQANPEFAYNTTSEIDQRQLYPQQTYDYQGNNYYNEQHASAPQPVSPPTTSQFVPSLPQQVTTTTTSSTSMTSSTSTTRRVSGRPTISGPLSVSQNYLAVPQSGQRIHAVADQSVAAASAVIDVASNAMLITGGLLQAARPMGELFGLFVPLLKDVVSTADNVLGLFRTAEHNKEICRFMVTRVLVAQGAIKPLLLLPPDAAFFFSEANYRNLQELRTIMGDIFTFVKSVSQVKGVAKIAEFKRFLNARSIEQSLRDLSEQLDSALIILNLGISIESAANREQQIAALQNKISRNDKIIRTVTPQGNASDDLEIVSTMAKVLSDTSESSRSRSGAQGAKEKKRLLDIINTDPLKFDEFEPLRIQSKSDKHISKWERKQDGLEVAFREIRGCAAPNDKESQDFVKYIRREVTILRMLAKQPDVVTFYGITDSGSKTFLVTEWPTHGTLRNYYDEYPDMLDWPKRIKFAFQISRALAYIQSATILHHDVRSDNVIITSHYQAKLANFGLSRSERDHSTNMSRLREQVRYMAPEKLENEKHRYDFKCEVYSFGVLLLEIAELKRPFGEDVQLDICQMRELVRSGKLSFSTGCGAPPKFREIAEHAQARDPMIRPDINQIVMVLSNLNESFENARAPSPLLGPYGASRPSSPLPLHNPTTGPQSNPFLDDDGNSVMSLDTVVKQLSDESSPEHSRAFDVIKRYANLNHPKAKFHLAVYLLKIRDRNPNFSQMDIDFMYTDEMLETVQLDLLNLKAYMLTKVERQLFGCKLLKEAADAGHTDAQCRYATVLRNGNQALKADTERAKYYLGKSAMNDHPSAYFYLAQIFENENMEQAIGYYKQAALNGHLKALEVLEKRGIKLS